MIKGDYDKLRDYASRNVCSEHKTPLEVAWYGAEKTWVLRCGHDHYPDAITRQLSLTEEYKAGEELPEYIEDKIKKQRRRKAMEKGKTPTAMTFQGIPATDLATGELLLPEVVKALVDYAHKYNLDPARGHIVLMYGKPYVTIEGYLFHAARARVAYTLQSKPLSDDDRSSYLIPEGAHAWLSEIIIGNHERSFTGLGVVTLEEMTTMSTRHPGELKSPVVAKHPWQLAQKRAEWQALRRAFPIGENSVE